MQIAGWSLGARPACLLAGELEAAGIGSPRGMFMLDDRRKMPLLTLPSFAFLAEANSPMCSTLAVVHLLCSGETAPVLRLGCSCLDIVCPSLNLVLSGVNWTNTFQADPELASRRAVYTSQQKFAGLADAGHFDIGIEHAWDVAKCAQGHQGWKHPRSI